MIIKVYLFLVVNKKEGEGYGYYVVLERIWGKIMLF